MFKKFSRLELDQVAPLASTIGRFRVVPDRSGQLGLILNEITGQLLQTNMILQEGRNVIVDATAIEVARSGICTGNRDVGAT
jgi:hypothetical protein